MQHSCRCGLRLAGSFGLALLGLLLPLVDSAAGAAADRYVTASIECVRTPGGETGLPRIEVAIENHSGVALYIAYLHTFGAGPDRENGLTGLRLDSVAVDPVIEIADGQTSTFKPEWAGVDLRRSDKIVALIVTSAGNLLPSCDDEPSQTITYDGAIPNLEGDEAEESARIATSTIGQLESWRAYPALYALLYPDAQSAISFSQIACWYVERFGPPVTSDVKSIYTTKISKLEWGTWTWKVTGEEFQQSAIVTYTQTVGATLDSAEPVESVMHLVRVDGIWRWFFGSSAAGVRDLPSECGLPATT